MQVCFLAYMFYHYCFKSVFLYKCFFMLYSLICIALPLKKV